MAAPDASRIILAGALGGPGDDDDERPIGDPDDGDFDDDEDDGEEPLWAVQRPNICYNQTLAAYLAVLLTVARRSSLY